MARLPPLTDEDEEASISPRETTREQWRQIEAESGLTAGQRSPPPEPSCEGRHAEHPIPPAHGEEHPGLPPEGAAGETEEAGEAEDFPMLEVEPVEPQPAAPPAQRAPPARPRATKKADSLEDVLALLEQNR